MIKLGLIGDPHITPSNLEESTKLLTTIFNTCKEKEATHILFLGDLFHTHASIRLEVLYFWEKWFKIFLFHKIQVMSLVGNHDMPGLESPRSVHSLAVLKNIYIKDMSPIIFDKPTVLEGIGFLPYYRDGKKLLDEAKFLWDNGNKGLLFAHQTFTGAEYENGFPAKDGIDPDSLMQETIISGHIHKSQQMGKCWYPGTPKWDTTSDANEDKGFWILDIETGNNSKVIHKEYFPSPCKKILSFLMVEGSELPILDQENTNQLELKGSSKWIAEIKKDIPDWVRTKAIYTDRLNSKKDNAGMLTFEEWVNRNYKGSYKSEDVLGFIRKHNGKL